MNQVDLKFFFALIVLLILLLIPRFDRLDRFGIDRFTTEGKAAAVHLADAGKYMAHVRYFRGEVDSEALTAPWAYRPLPVLLASLIPTKPMTAINLVNFAFLTLGLLFLLKTLSHIGVSGQTARLGGLAYVVSFPVFFYGSIGYIDPVLVGMMGIGLHFLITRQHVPFFVLLWLGAFVKDPYIIMLPAWAVYQLSQARSNWLKTILVSACAFLIFVGTIYLIRQITPVSANFFWTPKKEYFDFNFYRLKAWITWLITFGPVGFLACWYCLKKNISLFNSPSDMACMTGLLASITIIIYSFFSVYVDGRYIWTAYPFMIPLACRYWDQRKLRKENCVE